MSTTQPQSSWRRLLWEILSFSLLLAAIYGVWELQEYRKTQALDEQAEAHQVELDGTRQQLARATGAQARGEAKVVFDTFSAAVVPAMELGGNDAVDQAIGALILLPGIRFAHVLESGGRVIATSDRKLEATGSADERADWALGSIEARNRLNTDGTFEIAGRLASSDDDTQPALVLWLGYASRSQVDPATP